MSINSLARTHFIMTNPSHPGNVGAAARAMKTMGFERLRLVKPRFEQMMQHEEAIAFASGAQEVLANSLEFASFEEALQGTTLSFALTARPRDIGPNCLHLRAAAQLAKNHLAADSAHHVAVVFGTERSGLSNEQISHCHYICYIPANPNYSSLNIAQAMQLTAWELRYALLEAKDSDEASAIHAEPNSAAHFPAPAQDPLAPQEKVEALMAHWQEALEAIEFIDPERPKQTMLKMRYWLMRSRLTQNECDMLRGVCTQILKHANSA